MIPGFVPAAHFHFLTPLYEPLARPFLGKVWRRAAEELAKRTPQRGHVVDLGCGPGTLLRILRDSRSDLRLTGVDVDGRMVRVAREKTKQRGIAFVEGSIDSIPMPRQSADVAVSTLVFHHLELHRKHQALVEIRRILTPSGFLLLYDFSIAAKRSWATQLIERVEPEIGSQLDGQLLELARTGGAVTETLWTDYGCMTAHVLSFPADSDSRHHV